MTEYLHHVPGRLRIRTGLFRTDTASRCSALRKLRAATGVNSVRLNEKAACVTVCYDADETDPQQLMKLLDACECKKPQSRPVRNKRAAKSNWNVTREVGKIAFNVLVSRGVTSLLGGRI